MRPCSAIWLLMPLLTLGGLGLAPRSAAAGASLPGMEHGTLTHQERPRTYHVQRPPAHDRARPAPLVLALHGGGGSGMQLARQRGVDLGRRAAERGWVIAFPDGIARGWNDGRRVEDRRGRARRGVDDVGFLSRLIDVLHRTHGIDRRRVYATGISNGGFMSLRLGVELGAKIAAIAPVTASLQRVHRDKRPTHPMPVLMINGTKDRLVPFDGGEVGILGQGGRGWVLSTEATLRWWAKHNGCTQRMPRETLPNRAPLDGTRVHLEGHRGCTASSEVLLLRVEGGGHTWPGGASSILRPIVGRTSRDIDATRRILTFFARHKRAAGPTTGR